MFEAMPAEWQSLADTRFAQQYTAFERVLHICHIEWPGIRAAVGTLPGYKLAISANSRPADASGQSFLDEITSCAPTRIVFHGMSDVACFLIERLAEAGLADVVYIVFHGSTAQWHDWYDRKQGLVCLRLAGEGRVRKLHMMKGGFDYPVRGLYKPLLFNMSPRLPNDYPRSCSEDRLAFVPARTTWTKNIFTNVLGAALSGVVDRVIVFADGMDLPYPYQTLVVRTGFDPNDRFGTYLRTCVTLNVSVLDCHPMINLEAQAVGRPCLRGPLFLDALEDHPYVKIMTVHDVTSALEIGERLRAIVSMDESELQGLVTDYQMRSNLISLQRYSEFLDISP